MAMTQSEQQLLEEFADSKPAVQAQARVRWASGESYQSRIVSKYRDLHHYYNPVNQDHWPEDADLRPGKIHTTSNLCKAAVDVDARLESIPPRLTIPVATLTPEERKRAEAAEALLLLWLDLSGSDVWMHTLCQVRAMYGKGILKPYWDSTLKRGDVTVIENPANLRLGYGSSDYTRIDWAIYQYALSTQEIQLRWPNVQVQQLDRTGPPTIMVLGGDHDDPLSQKDDSWYSTYFREHSDYERLQTRVWDYWYKNSAGTVCNAVLINGTIVEGPTPHKELADIPYIVIELDHEPGSPEGIALIEPIMNLQDEFNRLLSHGLQHIADDVDPAWYISGPTADTVPPGMVPKAGEVTGVGENMPGAWPKAVNTFPISEMLNELWNEYHRLTGLPEILFGQTPGADTSGRAVAIQVEAAANRMDPRRRRLYNGIKELMVFWTIMAEKINPQISVGEDEDGNDKSVGVGDLVKGFRTWKIIAPEITPRDNFEVTQNEINKVNAKLSSLRASMNQIGVDAPEAELAIIAQEQANLKLNPAAVQAQVSVFTIMAQLEQLRMQNQQLAAQLGQVSQASAGTPPGSVLDTNAGQAALDVEQSRAQPTGFEDQNQPMTQAGSPPPPGAPAPGMAGPAQMTALTRQGEGLQQIAFNAGGQPNAQ